VISGVLRTEDYARLWLNGAQIGEFESTLGLYGWARVPKSLPVTLNLRAGENRLLVKLTSMHNAHSFAFNVPQLAPDGEVPAPLLCPAFSRRTATEERRRYFAAMPSVCSTCGRARFICGSPKSTIARL
jgi:hypothetical protein